MFLFLVCIFICNGFAAESRRAGTDGDAAEGGRDGRGAAVPQPRRVRRRDGCGAGVFGEVLGVNLRPKVNFTPKFTPIILHYFD